jgi:cytidylate kinase
MIVAVDGPVAAGKGTLARLLAKRFGYHYLDTGALYRAVGSRVLRRGHDPADELAATAAARALDERDLGADDLRTEAVGNAASTVAIIPAVRAALLDYQRNFARRPPGAVLDGRDIGSVVCPDAPVKLFVTAAPQVRAHRRFLELQARGEAESEADVLADLRARDERDSTRAIAPLKPMPDAHLLDTTNLSIEAALSAAAALVAARLKT